MHVDDFESLFSITNDLAQRVCSAQAEIQFDMKINVTCSQNEWRYFKASTKLLSKDFIAIDKHETKGDAILFYSFNNKNPNKDNTAAYLKQNEEQTRMNRRNSEFRSEFHLFSLEKNTEEYVYVSMQCLKAENEIELLFTNVDL